MERWKLSAAATLVLRDGRKVKAAEVLKLAIKELILAGTWKLATGERSRRLRGRQAVTVLVRGDQPPPSRVPHGMAHGLVASGPVETWGAVEGREIRAMAKHIARTQRNLHTAIVQRVATDLAHQGLVAWEERRLLGVFRRSVMRPTAEGERALEEYRRHEAALAALPASRDASDEIIARAAGLALLAPGAAAIVMDFGGDFDGAFDSSFDAGFSDGGGDGGGNGGGGGD